MNGTPAGWWGSRGEPNAISRRNGTTKTVTVTLSSIWTFNNVQFASGTKTFSAGNTMTVLGTLTLAGGIVNTGTVAR